MIKQIEEQFVKAVEKCDEKNPCNGFFEEGIKKIYLAKSSYRVLLEEARFSGLEIISPNIKSQYGMFTVYFIEDNEQERIEVTNQALVFSVFLNLKEDETQDT